MEKEICKFKFWAENPQVRETIQFGILSFSFAISNIRILNFAVAFKQFYSIFFTQPVQLYLLIGERVNINIIIDNMAFSSKFNHELHITI